MITLRSLRDAGRRRCSRFHQQFVEKELSQLQRSTPPVAITVRASRLLVSAAMPKPQRQLDISGTNPFMLDRRDHQASLASVLAIVSCLFAGFALLLPLIVGVIARLLP